MRCINCGAELDNENDIFCPKCYKEAVSKNAGDTEPAVQPPENNHRNVVKNNKRKNKKKKALIISLASVGTVIVAIVLAASILISSLLGSPVEGTLSGDLNIETGEDLPFNEDVKNIALFGLDTRQDDNSGRSDAIIVLSIDRKNKEIKLTSIARDTYITYENGRGDKITHAWAYGKANLAVKTLNRNFKLDITDYVSVNFYQFAEIIDYVGGVMIDVDADEMEVMNSYIVSLDAAGIDCELVTEPGYQLLNGGQALAYSRNRYTGSDLARGDRQREVLSAMFDKVKTMNVLKFPKLVKMILSKCTTTLEEGEILSIGSWALFNSPTIHSLGMPTKECGAKGQMISGTSYMVYDLNLASSIMHDFIYTSAKQTSVSSVTE